MRNFQIPACLYFLLMIRWEECIDRSRTLIYDARRITRHTPLLRNRHNHITALYVQYTDDVLFTEEFQSLFTRFHERDRSAVFPAETE